MANFTYNKAFKRDSQRVAFLICVGFCGYGVMQKLNRSVGCPLTRRYKLKRNYEQNLFRMWFYWFG
nr:hypothetical protein [Vibrio vulnificus]